MSDKHFASTKNLVPVHSTIAEQRPGGGAILVMRDGSFRMIIRSGAVNFDMKSQAERGGLTFAFGAMVNSLEVDFPIEIVSHSKMLDIDAYVRQFEPRLQNDRTPDAIRRLISEHKMHFEGQVKRNKLLQREIYIAVPWKGVSGPVTRGVMDEVPLAPVFKALSRKAESMAVENKPPTDLEIATARQQLEIRSDQVLLRLSQMGIAGKRLDDTEVRQLLYGLFHPSLSERQRDPGRDTDGMIHGFSSDEQFATRRQALPPSNGNGPERPSF
jgi:hypothetical protein